MDKSDNKNKKINNSIRSFIILIIAAVIYLIIFKIFNIGIPCVFRTLTGYKCPGCGMTHALSEIVNLNFQKAWEYNKLSITVFPVLCIYLLYRWVLSTFYENDNFKTWEYILMVAMAIIVIAYEVLVIRGTS